MLQLIRDRFTGVVAMLVIGAIGVTLVISFGNMDQSGLPGSFAAEVNGEEIDMRSYRRAVQNELVRQQEAFPGGLSELLQEQVERNVLESMVRDRVVIQYVRDSGFRIDDQQLSQVIVNQPVFQVGGIFSKDSYVAVLSSQGMAPEFYEDMQRAQLEVGQLQEAIVSSAFYTPSEFRSYIELLAEEREATIVVLNPAELAAGIVIEEGDLEAYYAASPDEFREEESVSIEYVEIRLDDIAVQASVDEQMLQDYYDANADRYVAEEQRQGRHILITIDDDTDEEAALKLAGELRQRILDGEEFVALVSEYSGDPVSAEQGGDLGWAGRGDYVDEAIEAAIYALEIGGISEPVRTAFGYHIIRLDEIKAGSLRSFAEVRDELLAELTKQQAEDQFYALAEQVDDLALENPASLDVIESETGLKVQRVEQFTRMGGQPFGYQAEIVEAVFGFSVLEDGENSPLIELEGGTAIVVRVDEHRPSSLQPLAEIRDQVEASVRLQQAGDVARERGEEFLTRLKAGEPMEAIAREFSAEVQQPGLLKRSSNEVGPELLAEIYRMPHPVNDAEVFRGITLADGGYAVFRLDKVVPGSAAAIPQEARDQRKQMLAQRTGNSSLVALIADLREKAKVTVASGLFDRPETF